MDFRGVSTGGRPHKEKHDPGATQSHVHACTDGIHADLYIHSDLDIHLTCRMVSHFVSHRISSRIQFASHVTSQHMTHRIT